jgi:hypothetical protein
MVDDVIVRFEAQHPVSVNLKPDPADLGRFAPRATDIFGAISLKESKGVALRFGNSLLESASASLGISYPDSRSETAGFETSGVRRERQL